MRFLIIRKADADTEAGKMPSQALLEAMLDYNQQMIDAGVLVDGTGLHPSARGARITFEGGTPIVSEGPFAETKELIAGFSMIEVRSKEEALAWVKRWPALDGGGNVTLELRQVFEAEEFGEEFTIEMQEQDAQLREQAAGNAARR